VKLKSERHHWWPETVSGFWRNDQGVVNWLLPDGTDRKAPPKQFGVIGNGHHIKLSDDPDEHTVWDESFEREFDVADSSFRNVIQWLQTLPHEHRDGPIYQRLKPCEVDEGRVSALVEGLVSLAVRSPMTREACVSIAERFRGPIESRERNRIIGLNMRHMHRNTVRSIGTRGKFVAIYSPDREFIFGDGFYHNITSPGNAPMSPRILAPLTPHLAMLYARPTSYSNDPKFMTLVVGADETKFFNEIVQVYSREAIFYVNERPDITDDFRAGKHRQYGFDNPVERLVAAIP
jgi:hypothetical protein